MSGGLGYPKTKNRWRVFDGYKYSRYEVIVNTRLQYYDREMYGIPLSDIITDVANISLALSFVVALIFGIVQVRAAARDRREGLALETLRSFQTHEFATLIHYTTSHDMPKSREELQQLPHKDQVEFIEFGQQMETLGILVAGDFISLDLVEKTLGSFVTTSWEKYKTMYMSMRETIPDPYMAEYFQWLAEHLEKRMRERPRVPFYKLQK